MIRIENAETFGIYNALYSMRNSYNSWDKSDSKFGPYGHTLIVGDDDYELAMRLIKAGPSHRKFLRMIECYMDITAPLYWWKEFDTYKVGTVANSCSTMHTITNKPFEMDDFSVENLDNALTATVNILSDHGQRFDARFGPYSAMRLIIEVLNSLREKYLETKDKNIWYQIIQLLPSSYNQKRTILLNYEVLRAIYETRKDHRLDEWRKFCKEIEDLPLSEFITGDVKILKRASFVSRALKKMYANIITKILM